MLEIKVCDDKKQIAAACKGCGKMPGVEFFLYTATNGGEQLAQALFEVQSDHVQVLNYDSDSGDFWLFDGMLRAGFNYAAEQGIENGLIPEYFRLLHQPLFAKLNYPVAPEFNITNFFQKYKNCRS